VAKTKKAPKKAAPKKRAPRLKQQHLEGMEPPRIPTLDSAIERYCDAMHERLPLTQAEKEAKDELIAQIHKHHAELGGATKYTSPDGYEVNFTDVTQVKVKMAKSDPESNGEAE
jgi:hypothetical protein